MHDSLRGWGMIFIEYPKSIDFILQKVIVLRLFSSIINNKGAMILLINWQECLKNTQYGAYIFTYLK